MPQPKLQRAYSFRRIIRLRLVILIRSTLLLICLTPAFASGCGSSQVASPKSPRSAATARPLLNSERIQQQFGSYGIDVLEEGDTVRISNLYSAEGSSKVTRTFAVVTYPPSIPAEVLPAHLEVKSGGSIGEVFAQQGWNISKQNLYFGELPVSGDWSGLYALMGGIAPAKLAVHVYEFVVSREGAEFRYATIAEVHHPDYLDKADQRDIYGSEYAGHRFQNDEVRSTLRMVRKAVLQVVPEAQHADPPRPGEWAAAGR